MNIGQKIKQYRNALGISGIQLGKKSHTGQSTISEIESGKRSPTIETLEKICSALDIQLTDLLSDSEPVDPETVKLLHVTKNLSPAKKKKITELIQVFTADE